jgi:putative acetyltransferase
VTFQVRHEREADQEAISAIIGAAFATAPHSDGTEAEIVHRLRDSGALTISLVAEQGGELVGHVSFSPVTIEGEDRGWFGLGPVAVLPKQQSLGVGRSLVEVGLRDLRSRGASGCVVLGEPAYYGRFGFGADPRLTLPGPPPKYFQALRWSDDAAEGEVAYHPAFGA